MVNTNELFGFLIRHDDTLKETEASINYNFELYESSFNLTDAGDYTSVIRLDQEQGLVGRYYKTTDFTSLVDTLARNDLDGEKYTQVDATIDFDLGDQPMISNFPTKFFSVKWEGFVEAPSTETFRVYVETYGHSDVYVKLNSQVLVTTWDLENKADVQYFADIALTAGEFYPIEVWFRQRYGETLLRIYWESDSIEKQILPKNRLFNRLYSEQTPFAFTVNPAETNPLSSILSGEDYKQAVVGA